MRGSNPIFFSLACLVVCLIAAGCGQFETGSKFKGRSFSFNFSSQSAVLLQPPSDKVDANCFAKSDYDACLFHKNPVAQANVSMAPAPAASTLDSLQVYGVKLTGLANSGKLENGTIRIETLKGSPVATNNPSQLKAKASSDTQSHFNQVMAYYWLNRASEYIAGRTGYFPAGGQSVRVVVDDEFAGWSSRTRTIHLKRASAPMAWSAELAIHYLGLANLHFASKGAVDFPSATKHRDCGLKASGCCSQTFGCSRAIASGVGDYFVALIFPEKPSVGETWGNKSDGLQACGFSRDLNAAAGRKVNQAFDACPAPLKGDAIAMGSVYASIWWEIRKAAAKASASGQLEIDVLFMNHLEELDGTDDFKSAQSKIRALDNALFQGRHMGLIDAEFRARGL